MQTIRKLILFGCAAAMLSMLVNTGGHAKATTQPQFEKFGATAEGPTRTPAAQLQVYLDNKSSIDAVLLSLGPKATLCDAIQAWTESGSPVDVSEGHPEDDAEDDASKPIDEKFVNYSPAEQPAEVSSRVVHYSSSCGSAASYSGDRKFGWRVRRAGGGIVRAVGWLFGRRR